MSEAIFFPGLVPTTFSTISEFARADRFARRRFAEADDVLGYPLLDAYATAKVYDWEIFEAGFMALTLALADWTVNEAGVVPRLCGGQSFGLLIGAVFTGTLTYADGLRLVRDSVRVEIDYFGRLAEPLGCHFFYRLESAAVDRLVEEFLADGDWVEVSVYLDNAVHAVSGTLSALSRFEQRIRQLGGVPFYTLNRAEHCSAVAELRSRLEREVYGQFEWRPARVPMLSDVDGGLRTDGEQIKQDLLDGWTTPVHWSTVSTGLLDAGIRGVHVVGPRNMFAQMTNNTVPTVMVTPKAVAQYAERGLPAAKVR